MLVRDRILDALARPGTEERLEVHNGELREKPSMTFRHGRYSLQLGYQLVTQLDRREYDVRVNHGRVRRAKKNVLHPGCLRHSDEHHHAGTRNVA
jgi:Uma2 family endonuclease